MTQSVAAPVRGRLSPEQVSEFRKEGYLTFREPVLPQAKFDGLRAHFEDKLSRLAPEVRPESMDGPHLTDTKLFEWLFADEVLDLVEPFLGPDIALYASHFICKPRGNGKRVPWHEDAWYWKTMLDPMQVVTVWIAIDPSTRENGCMYVIPRTHERRQLAEYEDVTGGVFNKEIRKGQFDESAAVPIELQPNQASLHDAMLIHGSPPNTSNIRRCGYTMRYISTRTKYNNEKAKNWHQIYLARGRDRAGNGYADPTVSYEHMARFREINKTNGH